MLLKLPSYDVNVSFLFKANLSYNVYDEQKLNSLMTEFNDLLRQGM